MSDLSMRASPGYTNLKQEDDELETLQGGKTWLISRKSPSAPSSPMESSRHRRPTHEAIPETQAFGSYVAESSSRVPVIASQQWPAYSPTDEPYEFNYPMFSGAWQPDQSFSDGNLESLQYHPYNQVPFVGSSYLSLSSMDSPVQGKTPPSQADPDASWRNLCAQFNQP